MPASSRHDFSVGSIPRTILRLSIPLIVAQVINALYNLVDRAYIGRMPGEGKLALAGVGITFPVILIITAFTNLCGTGGAPLCSIARGEGRINYAERIMGAAFAALLLLGAVLTVAGLLFQTPVMWMFGASENTIGYATDYLEVYLLGTPFVMVALGMNPFINSQGFARIGMFTVLIGAVANIILDPIFIFTLGMGVRGAALATVISQMLCAIWAIKFLTSDKPILRLRRNNVRLDFSILKRVLALGASTFTVSLTDSTIHIACNTTLLTFGGDLYVSAMTIISSIRQLIQMTLHGFSDGAKPVLGYNYGAGNAERVKASVKFLLIICSSYALLCWALIMVFPAALIRLFNSDPDILEIGVPSVRVYFLTFFMMCFQMTGQSSFTALGISRQAIFFSLLRKVVIVAPLALLLPRVTDLGVMGVFWAEPISDVIGPVACITAFYFMVWRKLDIMVAKKAALRAKIEQEEKERS